jgi:DNA-binding transcriptional LysR family regulator
MNISQLQTFLAVADEQSFRKAADRLFVAASPLSRRIREFERELGVPLFERDTRHVVLSREGRLLVPLAREIIDKIDAIPAALRRQDSVDVLRIGVVHGLHPAAREKVIGRLSRGSFANRVAVEMVPTHELERLLAQRKLDLSVLHYPVAMTGLDSKAVLVERVGSVAVPAGHPLATAPSIALADLHPLPMVSYRRSAMIPLVPMMLDHARAAGVSEFTYVTEYDALTLAQTVASGSAFAIVPDDPDNPLRRMFAATSGVALRPCDGFAFQMTTAVAWLRERAEHEELVRAVVRAVKLLKTEVRIASDDDHVAGLAG